MRYLTIILLVFSLNAFGQKISIYKYKDVDSLRQYLNGETISYVNHSRKGVVDTIYYDKMKHDVNIAFVKFLIIDSRLILKRRK